ncbi:MAG TPA: sugar ABC transporter substrate-binding protein [Streptosporangiaceae bacterium]|jgi:simple sugar transport system substrate-binding protein
MTKINPEVEEAIDTLDLPSTTRRRLLSGAGLASAGLAATALLSGCANASSGGKGGVGAFPSTPKWRFVFVNHVTTNPFFQPTQYGIQDACTLLNCTSQWTGSKTSIVPEMVNAMNTAVSGKADGIAVSVVDVKAFKDPVDKALQAGIPVVSYNADGAVGNPGSDRLAYVGQDLFVSGQQVGMRLASLMTAPADVVGFIATPGALNIQPRIDGAKAALQKSGKMKSFKAVTTGAETPQEISTIDAFVQAHGNVKAYFSVDGGSTEGLGDAMTKHKLKANGVVAGGFDLEPKTLSAIKAGNLDFTVDQQPYLQGFLPVLYLYLYKLSGGLVAPSETNTGLKFVTKDTVGPYQTTKTRYEGNSEKQEYVKTSGPIAHAS